MKKMKKATIATSIVCSIAAVGWALKKGHWAVKKVQIVKTK